MCHIQISSQLARAILCLKSSECLRDGLVFAALALNELNMRIYPASSLTSRYELLLKELGVKGEGFSEEEIVLAVSSLSDEQQQALCAAIIAMHAEVLNGDVFD